MIPILYNKTGNTKITNLTDCIQCIVTEERNGMFEAELIYSVHSSNSDKLIRGNIIVADANDTLKEQKFRIYKISKPINGRIKILARHISFDMARDVVTGLVIDNQSCEYALNKLFSSSQFSQRFTGHSDIVNSQSTVINGTTHILKAIVGVEGSIIDTFGTSPEILRDNYDFYIYENRGHDNGVTIEYGKNLTGLNLDTDDSNMITRIRATAKYRDENQEEVLVVSSPEFIDSPYIANYETPFIQEIDFSSHFKDDDIPTPLRLKTLAEEYFVNNKCDLPSENATLSFIPLSKCVGYEGIQDKISLCDTVTVIDYRYNLTTKVKVIKVSYNTLKERYENMEVGEPRSRLGDIISNGMNTVKGEKGDKGDKGEQGAPGNIGDFPDALPTTPILTSSLYGFASIELSWTFESQPYYTYELYASRTQNFTPNEFDLLFEGKGSTFLFQAKPNETWYFRVRAVNSHGRATNFSSQITVTTTKIDDLSNYVENAAIGEALIGTLSLDRGWVGTLKGNYIDAKQLSVTDGNGKRTLFIDSFGNVSLDVTELKISSKQPATTDDLENLKGEINENIDNIEIGGKNYVKNYNFARKNYAWLCAGTGVVDTENQWGKMTTNTDSSQIYQVFKNGEFKNGDVLTIQYEMKCNNIEVNTGSQSFNFAVYLTGYAADGSTYVDEVARFHNHNTDYTEYSNWKKVVSTCTVSSTKEYTITKLRLYCRNFKGDIYFKNIKIERGNKATDIGPAPEDTEVYTDNLIYDLQEQLDGKIQTYSQSTDPSTNWTATEKANHEGDIWYNTSTKNTYRWNGSSWVLLQNAEAQSAKEIAQTKAQVFTGTPTTPYYKGDLWVTALDGTGIVKTCITTRVEGSYIASDWVENLKYTDDTLATQLQEELDNLSIGGRNYIQFSDFVNNTEEWVPSKSDTNTGSSTVDNGVMTFIGIGSGYIQRQIYSNRTATALQELEKGETYTISIETMIEESSTATNAGIDLRFNKPDNSTSTQIRATADCSKLTPNVWTKIQKTATINWSDDEFNYWRVVIQGLTDGKIHFRKPKLEKGNKATDWTPAPEDTDTYIDNLVTDLQGQLDGKIETYSQPNDPSTNWTTTELKTQHTGDLWYNTSTFETKRWNGTAWVLLENAEAQSAKEIAQKKAQIFTERPTPSYYKGDLWVTALDGTGVIKTCIKDRTSGNYTESEWVENLKYTDDTFANQLKNEIDKLSFGSRNYFRYGWTENQSVKENLSDCWTSYQGSFTRSNSTSSLTDDYNFCLLMPYDSQYTYCNANLVNKYRSIEIPRGTEVTLSMYLAMNANCKGYAIRAINDENTVEFTDIISGTTNPTDYKISKTFNMPYNKTSIRIYNNGVKDTSVTTSSGLFFNRIKLEKGDFVSGYSEAPEDTQGYVDNLVADLQEQLDGKIETYSQSNDPSANWTTIEKPRHKGDIWYNTSSKSTYRWNGTAWEKLSNQEAIDASNLASTKAQVFIRQPITPYYEGDLWVTALDGTGIVKTCIKDRTSGSFTDSDWVENLKYTGDDLANEIKNELDNLTIGGRNYIQFSDFVKNTEQWIQSKDANNTGTTTVGNGVMTITSAGASYIQRQIYSSQKATALKELENGVTYTLSVEVMVEQYPSKTGTLMDLRASMLDGTTSTQIRIANDLTNVELNKWIKLEKTGILNYDEGNLNYWRIIIQGVLDGKIHFRKPKLEKGNRATDWNPAPEDTNSIIDDAIKDLPTIDDVGDAKDSAIIASKIEIIKQSYNVLKSEYNKNIQQSEIIYRNSYLEGTAKTNLNTAITNYKTAFTSVTSARDSIVNANTITTSQANAWNTAITNIQTSTDTLAKRVQEAQTYIDTAIYNASVDYTNQAIPDALTGYAKESYVDDAMEQAINDAKDGMVSSTDLTVNNEEILLSAASMGQYNLLRNSDFRNGFDNWASWGTTDPHYRVITTSDSKAMNGENNACIYSNSATIGSLNVGNRQDVVLETNSIYTISYWVNSVNSTMKVQVESYNSNNEKTVLAGKSYVNINGNGNRNTWKFDSITFTVPSDSNKVRAAFFVTNCTNAVYKALLVKPMLVSGNKAQAWTGHPDEIYVGVVSITEKKGLMVEHSNANTKTIMSADGFSIEDNNGDVLAWLSSKDQWTELKADKVFASNIENIYTGDSNLYVDHSATVAGDGTSDKPFNSFQQLKEYLNLTPVINKDLYITVKDPGFIINEPLILERLHGTGFIKITLEGQLVIANWDGSYCINLRNIKKWVWIVGNRNSITSNNTGAVLQDGKSQNGHGIECTDVERLEVDAITIACKNWGINCERSHLYTWHVDFGKCYNAVELRYQSIYYTSDDVGSCTDFVRLKSGSFAYWGYGTVRPMGNISDTNGVYYASKELTPTSSPRYSSSNPSFPTSTQNYTKSYNCTSKQSYQYNWSNWSTDGSCKQGSWGNLSPYVKKLA